MSCYNIYTQKEGFSMEKKKMSLALQIFIALVLAIVIGLILGTKGAGFANSYIKPFGTIFLNLIKFIVCPIVLVSIINGIISMKDIKTVGSIGLKTIVFYLCTTAIAITIGLLVASLAKGLFPVLATTNLSYSASDRKSVV